MERREDNPLLMSRISTDMRILNWNVYYGNSPQHGDDVIAAIRSFDCDVVMLYELSLGLHLPMRISQLYRYGVFVDMNYRRWLRPVPGGAALFSRFPIEGWRVVKTIENGFLRVRRHYLEARVQIAPDYPLTIGMIHHTLPFEFGYSGASRKLLRQVLRHKEKYLFTTDLNAMPSCPIAQAIGKRLVHLGPSLEIPSHPTNRWFASITPQRRLDYAFATPDVADMLVDEARFGESYPSDHKPLFVHLKIKK